MRATQERGWKMKKVTVRKIELLEKVQANYRKHKEDFAAACRGYAEDARNLLNQRSEEIAAAIKNASERVARGGLEPAPVVIPAALFDFRELRVPVTHEKDYEQVIQMLQMSTDDTITLEADEFACYVMDDWSWKREFQQVTSFYKGKVL